MENAAETVNKHYRVALRYDPDGYWVAEHPELPGCIADGEQTGGQADPQGNRKHGQRRGAGILREQAKSQAQVADPFNERHRRELRAISGPAANLVKPVFQLRRSLLDPAGCPVLGRTARRRHRKGF